MKKRKYRLTLLSAALALRFATSGPEAAEAANYYSDGVIQALREVQSLASEYRYREAESAAKSSDLQVMLSLVQWQRMQNADAFTSPESVSYAVKHFSTWPNWDNMQGFIEKSYDPKRIPAEVYRSLFKQFKPVSPEGKILKARIDEATQNSDKQEREALLREGWRRAVMDSATEDALYDKYRSILTEDDVMDKAEFLTLQGEHFKAGRLIARLPAKQRKVFQAWAEYKQGRKKFLQALEDAGGQEAQDHPLFALEIIKADVKEKRYDRAYARLVRLPEFQADAQYKDWWELRKRVARELFDTQEYYKAYRIVSRHGFTDDVSDLHDAEWMAGWLALVFLKKPAEAIAHFERMENKVQYPVSSARAQYWLGRAYVAGGDPARAMEAYKRASAYKAAYYGQLAMRETDDPYLRVPTRTPVTDEDRRAAESSPFIRGAKIWHDLNRQDMSRLFLRQAVEAAKTDGERYLAASLPFKVRELREGVEAGRYAYRQGALIPECAFPVLPESVTKRARDMDFVHGIILQESRFDASATSPAGAAGLMQIMPDTARILAGKIGLSGPVNTLLYTPGTNVQMGAQYVHDMLDKFGESRVMAIASYNAGPARIYDWMSRFGNPTRAKSPEQIVNWVEIIPYYETRNYVQRVIENINVYSALLSGKPVEMTADRFR